MDWFNRDIDWYPRVVVRTVALVALLLVPTSLQAQSFSIAPELGVYMPTQPMLSAVVGGQTPQTAEFKQEISLSIGGRMALGFGERFGVEISGAYMPSSVTLSASGVSVDTTLAANLITGTGQVWFQVMPSSSPVSLGLSGGLSVTSRGGEAFSGAGDTTELGGVLGVSLGLRVGPFIHLMVTAEDYIYNLDPDLVGLPAGTTSPTQHDVHLNFGVGIPLLGM